MRLIYEDFYSETLNAEGIATDAKLTYPDNFNFAYDALDKIAEKTPDAKALIYKNIKGDVRTFTFSEIARESIKLANMFADKGIGKGDPVMLIMKRRYEFWLTIMALHRIGAITIPTSHLVTNEDISVRLEAASAKAIVIVNEAHVCEEVDKVFADKVLDDKIIKFSVGDAKEGYIPLMETAASYSETMDRVDTLAMDPMLYYFTSGTAGSPKCVVHNFLYPLGHIVTARNWHAVVPGGVHLTVADSGWAKFVWGKLYGQWLCETCILCYDYDTFYAGEMLKLLEEQKVTTFCAPPTIYKYLVRENIADYDLSSLQQALSAGEHLPEPVAEKFKKATGIEIREGFGQTESPIQIFTPVGVKQIPGSIGMRNPLLKFKVLDEDLNEVKTGEAGELCLAKDDDGKLPVGLFTEYLGDKDTFDEVWEGGVYHTHDRVYVDDKGYYFYIGRCDDVIKSSGYRIGPSEVEDVLLEHDAVKECAVTGYPSATRGELIKATVILEDGYEPSNDMKRELQEFVKANTALYKYPRMIEFVDDMPRSTSGKISRRLIKDNDLKQIALKEKKN